MLALLLACGGPVALTEVEIVGGTPAQRAAAADELAALDAAMGPGRLRIRTITFDDVSGAYAKYVPLSHKIVVDDVLDPDGVRRNLRHELCHALDLGEGLLDDPTVPFDAFGEELYDRVLDHGTSARRRRSEAMAQVCELGPFGAAALAQACPGDDATGTALAAWVLANAWAEHVPDEPWPLAERASASPEIAWDELWMEATVEPSRARLTVGSPEASWSADVDLATGEVLDGVADLAPGLPPPPTSDLPVGAHLGVAQGWDLRLRAAAVELPVTGLATGAPRLLGASVEGWTLVGDGCLDADRGRWALFTADEAVWLAWGDGPAVTWAPLDG